MIEVFVENIHGRVNSANEISIAIDVNSSIVVYVVCVCALGMCVVSICEINEER